MTHGHTLYIKILFDKLDNLNLQFSLFNIRNKYNVVIHI